MAAHLSGGRVNIGLVREAARKELLNCLDKCPGSKVRCTDIYLDGIFALNAFLICVFPSYFYFPNFRI